MGLVTGAGAVVVAGWRLAAGGQGEVFAVASHPGFVFKRYLRATLDGDPTLERRLQVMIGYRPAQWREAGSGHITLAWPVEVVREDGRFVGFLMPLVDMAETVGLHRVTNPTDRRFATGATSWAQGFTWRYLVVTAVNLAHATHVLHEAGVVIGDFNESNIRAWRQARVTLLDCDSMQISDPVSGERFFCPVGRLEFTPPELLGANWATTVRHSSSDLFALAIHLYQLLLEGEHPFRGAWRGPGEKPPVPELARQGIWAHQEGGLLAPRPAAIGAGLLPPAIAEMFRRTFEDGAVDPSARPAALEWRTALTGLVDQLRQCTANQAHFYPGSLPACPWCQYVPPAAPTVQRPRPPSPGSPAPVPSGPRPPGRRRGRRAALAAAAIVVALVGVLTGFGLAAGSGPSPVRTLADLVSASAAASAAAVPADITPSVWTVAFSPNGTTLAAGDDDGGTYLWNAATGRSTAPLTASPNPSSADPASIRGVAFSPDGATLAAGDAHDGRVHLWNVATRRTIATLAGPQGDGVNSVAFSPDGKTLAVANGPTYLWNVATRHIIATLTDPASSYVTSVAFSPDGVTLAASDDNGHAYLWDVATGHLTATFTDPAGGGVWAVAFSPDGATLAIGDNNGTSLWSIAAQQMTAAFADPGSKGGQSVAFSPDGKTLATGDGNGRTYLWDVATGHLAATLADPGSQGVTSVAFSPDGKMLATGDADGSTYLWNASTLRG